MTTVRFESADGGKEVSTTDYTVPEAPVCGDRVHFIGKDPRAEWVVVGRLLFVEEHDSKYAPKFCLTIERVNHAVADDRLANGTADFSDALRALKAGQRVTRVAGNRSVVALERGIFYDHNVPDGGGGFVLWEMTDADLLATDWRLVP